MWDYADYHGHPDDRPSGKMILGTNAAGLRFLLACAGAISAIGLVVWVGLTAHI